MDAVQGRVALVFPGQGSQFVGMARELAGVSSEAEQAIAEADETLGVALSRLMFDGPSEMLEDTYNAQPAILAASVAALRATEARLAASGRTLAPAMVAGHSLGEFSALVAAGALEYRTVLSLVRERGRLMKEAGEQQPGGMAAVLGLEDVVLRQVCAEASDGGIVVLANANCPGQTVISGEVEPLERAMELARERGAKRVARLGVSIASHSPLMAEASDAFAKLVAATPMTAPSVPVVANITARPLTDVDEIRAELSAQMRSPVDWTGSVRTMIDAGIESFVEFGPGNVMAGLIKRIDRRVRTLSIADLGLDLPAMTAT